MEYLTTNLMQYCSIFSRVHMYAQMKPAEAAIVEVSPDESERTISWMKLENLVNRFAHALKKDGIRIGSKVVVSLPNSIENAVSTLAVWRLGGCAIHLPFSLVNRERISLLELIKPDLVIAEWSGAPYKTINVTEDYLNGLPEQTGGYLPDVLHNPCKAVASGGSTGTPKIIVENGVMGYRSEDFKMWHVTTGQRFEQVQLVSGAMYHSLFNTSFYFGLAMGHKIILMKKFDEALLLKLVQKYKVNSMALVPTMMSRILQCTSLAETDLSSIATIHHAGASCPVWLKRAWTELIGPEKIHEFYSMSEKIGMTHIRGDEWLGHVGSVGKPVGCLVEILDKDGDPVPPGVVGDIYFRSPASAGAYYLGCRGFKTSKNGSTSVGDLGWLDKDGYLYIVDRRSDMIVSGGKNIYAAEVENALREYPLLRDIVVIGLSDEKWGRRVHAVVELNCPKERFSIYDFARFGYEKLSNYKMPKTLEIIDRMPRNDAGKLRRNDLVEERESKDSADRFTFYEMPHYSQIQREVSCI